MSSPLSINETPHSTGLKDATSHIGNILLQQRFDVGPALFDEALHLCKERKFSTAADRLRMLRCLDPSHVGGVILLSKVLARLDQWDEANTILTAAVQQNMDIPKSLCEAIQSGQRRFKAKESQQHLHNIQKLKDQLKKTRSEFKSIDNENNQNLIKVTLLERSLQKWSRTCALVTGITIALLFFSWQLDSTSNAAVVPSPEESLEAQPPPPSAEISEPKIDVEAEPEIPTGSVEEVIPPAPVEEVIIEEPEPVATPEPPRAQYPTVHTVRSGDTLSEIAEKYYKRQSLGSWLAEQNNTSAQSLQLGQELLIPSPPPEE